MDSIKVETERSAAAENDLALLVGRTHKTFIIRLKAGDKVQTHRGVLNHDDLIGQPWGSQVFSHQGSSFFFLQPSLADILLNLPRNTQILYPKDIGFILVTMGIGPGMHIVEAGTGSGAFTTALAFTVGEKGHVYSYENRAEMQNLAKKNLTRFELEARVSFILRDIAQGFDQKDADALFLDLPNPEDYISQVKAALKPGGFFGSILPTTNQVSRLLVALGREDFGFIEVCETLLRYYKPVADRLRPADRMIAHTGYLIFARAVLPAKAEQENQINSNN
ncbi:MAG: tRNA (adenine-N1)-methyltransferase [Anaerolineales bacterium]|nr:tRNA (adenine-N1)-methyltransferase [Anaerolineales bacterium]